jgi:putative oxidoreductase
MLSIVRIVVGLLYMEHGLAKILDFPHQPNHASYALLTLNPGLQGLLESLGGLLLALGFVHPLGRVCPRRPARRLRLNGAVESFPRYCL